MIATTMQSFRHSKLSSALRLVIAAMLLAQGALAAAAMARMDAGRLSQPAPLELVICSPDGLKIVKLPADGDGETHENCECECGSLCSSKTPATRAGETTAQLAAVFWTAGQRASFRQNRLPGPDRSGDPCAPRAPPAAA